MQLQPFSRALNRFGIFPPLAAAWLHVLVRFEPVGTGSCKFSRTGNCFYSFAYGALYYVKNSGNFVESQRERCISVRSRRNMQDHLWRWSTLIDRNLPLHFDKTSSLPCFSYVGIHKRNKKIVRAISSFLLIGLV